MTLHQSQRLNFGHRKIGFHFITSPLFIFALLSTLELAAGVRIRQDPHYTKHDTDDFADLRFHNILFVDKSLLVEEFLKYNGTQYAQIVVRPKGWGKSTNLNMLEKFFQIEVDERGTPLWRMESNNHILFSGGNIRKPKGGPEKIEPLKIVNVTNAIERRGRHPVVLLRLKNATGDNYEELEARLKSCVVDVFNRHKYLSRSSGITQKELFERYLAGDFNSTELICSLNFLTLKLREHFCQDDFRPHFCHDVIVLVDDYDIPLISAYRDFNSGTQRDRVKVERLLEHLLDGARKRTPYRPPADKRTSSTRTQHGADADSTPNTFSNTSMDVNSENHVANSASEVVLNSTSDPVNETPNLAMFVGVLDLSFESLQDKGLLNFDKVYTLFDKPFSKFFGITDQEIRSVLMRTPTTINAVQLRLWYDGYPEEMKLKPRQPTEPDNDVPQVLQTTHFYNTRSVMRCALGHSGAFDYYGDPIQARGLIEDILSSDEMQTFVQEMLCGRTHWMNAYPYYASPVRWSRTDIQEVLSDNFTILLFNGFLSSCEAIMPSGPYLGISNKEMRRVFQIKQMHWVFDKFRTNSEEFSSFTGSLYTGMIAQFEESLQRYISRASEFVRSGEDKAKISYNGLMVALKTNLENVNLTTESTKWDGRGNDVFFVPRPGHSKIAIIVRYAIVKEVANLTQAAKIELEQIKKLYVSSNGSQIENRYPHVGKIIKVGIAFCAEKVKVEFESNVTSCDIL